MSLVPFQVQLSHRCVHSTEGRPLLLQCVPSGRWPFAFLAFPDERRRSSVWNVPVRCISQLSPGLLCRHYTSEQRCAHPMNTISCLLFWYLSACSFVFVFFFQVTRCMWKCMGTETPLLSMEIGITVVSLVSCSSKHYDRKFCLLSSKWGTYTDKDTREDSICLHYIGHGSCPIVLCWPLPGRLSVSDMEQEKSFHSIRHCITFSMLVKIAVTLAFIAFLNALEVSSNLKSI